MSLFNQQVQLQNLMPLLRSSSIKGFMRGTILFPWPWRCTTPSSMIWIVSSGSVPIFSTIDDWEVIYPSLFTFNFSSNVLILLFNVLQFQLQKAKLCWQVMFILNLPLLLDPMICMSATLGGQWVRSLLTMKGVNLLVLLVLAGCVCSFLSPL